jgi:hypothetical protein
VGRTDPQTAFSGAPGAAALFAAQSRFCHQLTSEVLSNRANLLFGGLLAPSGGTREHSDEAEPESARQRAAGERWLISYPGANSE